MLTLLKKIFTWWNQDTFGTRLKTIFFGRLAGTDQFGNESANGEELKELRKENVRFWKDVMLEDVSAIEGMQEGRNSPVYNGGNFSPVMDQPTHQFHKWIANSLL